MTEKPRTAGASRRRVVGGMAGGVLAAITNPVQAQQASAAAASAPAGPVSKQDPTKQYPQPPFKAQQQEWPGLAGKMEPRPDHGEKSYKGSGRLAGRKALITGGDSGMGRAGAIAFAREGADVAFGYLPAEEPDAREVVQLIEAEGRKAVPLPGDIRDEAFCEKLVEDAVSRLGGLDILVSNAARQHPQKELAAITTEAFDWTFKTNVYAMFWITKAALKHMEPGSSIIITSSVNAYDPDESLVDYAMTKACGMNFAKSLAKQVAKKGIRVNAVAPGPIWTPLQPSGGQFPEKLPQFGSDTPMGRPGQPGELASIYVLLASQEDSYATGQVYGAVGGRGGP
ncbi:SDR family oxidoreductase [Mesorhizobium sp. B2-4-17]|uniref:SDR family oxidoreductase n=1 Tax=Mesorhizobium sp. B2-4-17 TaxID=2589932 RepID=UPI0011262667|nr:SDR family oxidoreductase [Mesorhizobium sp. B2-4-17]TPK76111.1 SDR family oxidoreductase [Mesorhizobium sp. B2-4-17]